MIEALPPAEAVPKKNASRKNHQKKKLTDNDLNVLHLKNIS